MAVVQADREGLKNFSVLVSHVLVPPAMEAILSSPSNRVQGFLAAGHVCTVMGTAQYQPLVDRFRVPIVITGFEPLDILDGLRRVIAQLEDGRAELENAYARAVQDGGNSPALAVLDEIFEVTDRNWRGIGEIPVSGWRLRERYRTYDAAVRFDTTGIRTKESGLCRSGEVLQGLIKPHECAAFGKECTPRNQLGATMVSSEGACAAYYLYRRMQLPTTSNKTREVASVG
jgi:hydrogenase expression/formation protein HypD